MNQADDDTSQAALADIRTVQSDDNRPMQTELALAFKVGTSVRVIRDLYLGQEGVEMRAGLEGVVQDVEDGDVVIRFRGRQECLYVLQEDVSGLQIVADGSESPSSQEPGRPQGGVLCDSLGKAFDVGQHVVVSRDLYLGQEGLEMRAGWEGMVEGIEDGDVIIRFSEHPEEAMYVLQDDLNSLRIVADVAECKSIGGAGGEARQEGAGTAAMASAAAAIERAPTSPASASAATSAASLPVQQADTYSTPKFDVGDIVSLVNSLYVRQEDAEVLAGWQGIVEDVEEDGNILLHFPEQEVDRYVLSDDIDNVILVRKAEGGELQRQEWLHRKAHRDSIAPQAAELRRRMSADSSGKVQGGARPHLAAVAAVAPAAPSEAPKPISSSLGTATAQSRIQVGDHVGVIRNLYIGQEGLEIRAGWQGTVEEVNPEDVLVRFAGQEESLFVLAKDLGSLIVMASGF